MAGKKKCLSSAAKKAKCDRDKARTSTRVVLEKQKARWVRLKVALKAKSDHKLAEILLDSYLSTHANCESPRDEKYQVSLQPAKVTPSENLSFKPEMVCDNEDAASDDGSEMRHYYISTANSTAGASKDHSCLPVATTQAHPADMSHEMFYQVTMMLNLKSDWKCPVVVTTSNATVCSSELIGSPSHAVKVVNSHMLEVTSLPSHNPRSDVVDQGSGIAVSPDLPSVGDTVLKNRVKLELNESTDTASEIDVNDKLTEYDDTDVSEDDVPNCQDDAKNDPDWDPEDDDDLGDAPGDPESSCSDGDGNSVGGEPSDPSAKTWKCQACDFCCHAQYILRIHVSKTHYKEASRSGQCMCRLCGKMEDSFESLQEHRQVTHDNTEEHRCPVCRQLFTSYCQFQTHLDSHEHKHKCDTCGRTFVLEYRLRSHVKYCHGVSSVESSKRKICEICGHLTATKRQLETHQMVRHGIDFGKRFPCTECKEVCKTSRQLNAHTARCHMSSQNYTCDICSRVFKQADTLRVHLENVHWHTNRQTCPYCQKEFASKKRLDSHVNIRHTKKRCLACPWPGCVKTFGRNVHLQVHMRIHTDERPLACPHCDFRARQRHSLDYHLDKYHKDFVDKQKVNCPRDGQSNPSEGDSDKQIASNHTNENQITPEQTDNVASDS